MITELRLKSPDGGILYDIPILDFNSVSVVSRLNEASPGEFILPIKYLDFVQQQAVIEVWREPNLVVAPSYLFGNTCWFADYWELTTNKKQVRVKAKDAKAMANWRVIARFSGAGNGASYTSVYGDDLIKTILTNANSDVLSGTTGISITRSYATYLAIEAATSSGGVTIDKAFAWQKDVLGLFREISDLSVQKGGQRIFFDIIREAGTGSQFLKAVTYVGQTGANRTGSDLGTSPLIFSEQNGNLTDAVLSYDYSEAASIAYACGQDTGTNRVIKAKTNTSLGLTFPRETLIDARQASTSATVQAEADAELRQSRPRKKIKGRVVETKTTVFGKDFNIGDKVRVEYRIDYVNLFNQNKTLLETFDAWVEAVAIAQSDGQEKIDVMLESAVDL